MHSCIPSYALWTVFCYCDQRLRPRTVCQCADALQCSSVYHQLIDALRDSMSGWWMRTPKQISDSREHLSQYHVLMCMHYCRLCILNLCGRWLCCTHYYCHTQIHEWTNTSPLPYSPLRGPLHLRKVHALVFKTMFSHRFLSELKQSGFVWPNCGFNISTRASKRLNGSARPYWRMMLVSKIWLMLITTTKSFKLQFWWCRQNIQRDHITWLIIAIWGQCQDVCVLKNVQIELYMCATCHALIPFCSMHPEILTTRAQLNGDQFCWHVYVAWPNYSNHCCRQ